MDRDYQEIEEDEEPQIFYERQRIKSILKQTEALRSRMVLDMYISENPKETPERGEESKNRLEKNKVTYEKNEKEKKDLLERLGIKKPVLEKEIEFLQKQKKDLDRLIEGDRKTIADLDSLPYKIEAAEARIEQREKENGFQSILTKLSDILGLKIADLLEKK